MSRQRAVMIIDAILRKQLLEYHYAVSVTRDTVADYWTVMWTDETGCPRRLMARDLDGLCTQLETLIGLGLPDGPPRVHDE